MYEVAGTNEGTILYKDSLSEKVLKLRASMNNDLKKVSNICMSNNAQYVLSATANICSLLNIKTNEIIRT